MKENTMQDEINRLIATNTLRYKGRTLTDFGQVFQRAIEGTRADAVALDHSWKVAKLMEEVGELSEAVMHRDMITYKERAGTVIEEAADVILMLIDILATAYDDESPDRIVAGLEFELMKKLLKWEKGMWRRDSEEFQLYKAIHEHPGFTKEAAYDAFAHLAERSRT